MSRNNSHTITAAWITGGLGCIGAVITVVGGIIIAYFQFFAPAPQPKDVNVNIAVPTSPPAITQVIPTAPETVLEVINNSDDFVCYLYMIPVGSTTWGEDWLGEGTQIPPNRSHKFVMETGMYHLLAENCDGVAISQLENTHIEGEMWWTIK